VTRLTDKKGHLDLPSTSRVPCLGLGLSRRAVAARRRRFGVDEGSLRGIMCVVPWRKEEIEAVQVIGVCSHPASTSA
jgi:hypothetical protein